MTLEEAKQYISSVRWQYAKTYVTAPHEYTVLEWEPETKEQMIDFANFILENGYKEKFYSKTYTVIQIDEYKYWSMDFPTENTNLINRTFIDEDRKTKIVQFVQSPDFKFHYKMSLKDIEAQYKESTSSDDTKETPKKKKVYFKTLFTTYKVRCPHCRKYFDFKKYTQINILVNPELKEKLEDESIFESACECGYKQKKITPFIYFNEEQKLLIILYTSHFLDCEALLEQLGKIQIPKKIRTGIHFREVYQYKYFLEKMHIFDSGYFDRVVELAKYIDYVQSKKFLDEHNFSYSFFELSPKKVPQIASYDKDGKEINRFDCAIVPGLFGQIRDNYDLDEEGVFKIDWEWAKEIYTKHQVEKQKEEDAKTNYKILPYSSTYEKAPNFGIRDEDTLSTSELKDKILEIYKEYENTSYELVAKNWCVCRLFELQIRPDFKFKLYPTKASGILKITKEMDGYYDWKDDENGTLEEKLENFRKMLIDAWKISFTKADVGQCFAGFALYFLLKNCPREEYINLAIESAYKGQRNMARISGIPKQYQTVPSKQDFKEYQKKWKLPCAANQKLLEEIQKYYLSAIVNGQLDSAVYFLNLLHNYYDEASNEIKNIDNEINRLLKDIELPKAQ